MHPEFKGQTDNFAELCLEVYDRTELVEKRGEEMAERQKCLFPFSLPLHFPPFSFPKLRITRKTLRMKIMTRDVSLKSYKIKKFYAFFSLLHYSYSKPWIVKYV